MLRPGKLKKARQSTVFPETFDLQFDQHDIFEIDRSNMVLQLRTIRRAINESAEEMEMVANERVFAESLSRNLTRSARKLYQLAEDLTGLHRMVERAHLPKEPERSNSDFRQRPRPKRRT
jgi:hypothetical protein